MDAAKYVFLANLALTPSLGIGIFDRVDEKGSCSESRTERQIVSNFSFTLQQKKN